jgi:NAD+ synthase
VAKTPKTCEFYLHSPRLPLASPFTTTRIFFDLPSRAPPNLLEHDQGFFVKHGDGSADLKPIAHLYKSQVYQLAEYLGIPEEIRGRRPTTDTYSLDQTQEEFYFGLSLQQTDLSLYALDHGVSPEQAADAVGLTPDEMQRVYQVIRSKREAARYLHMPPVLIEGADELR